MLFRPNKADVGAGLPVTPASGPRTVDFSSAYRDSSRGMTLKALQQRQRELQEAAVRAAAPRQIGHPLQGVAQIAEVVGSGIREGRAANAEAAGRARFAELLAGGLTQDEIGEAMGIDPETAQKYQERIWSSEDNAAAAAARQAELEQGHGWDVDAATARVQAEKDAAAAQVGAQSAAAEEAAREADKAAERNAVLEMEEAQLDAAVKSGAMTPEQADAQRELSRRKAEAEIADAAPQTYRSPTPDDIARWKLDDPSKWMIDEKSGKPTPLEKARSAADIKATGDFEAGLVENRATQVNLRKALELAPNIMEGSGFFGMGGAKQRADLVLKTPDAYGPEIRKQAEDTQAYFNIMDKEAIMAMSNALTGATTEYEMKQFVKIMSDERTPLATKQAELTRMIAKVKAHEQRLMGQVAESGGKTDAGAEQLAPPPSAEAPAPAPAPAPDDPFGIRPK